MNLIHSDEMIGRNAKAFRHTAAILGNLFGCIVRSVADIEAGIDAIGNAALAREKPCVIRFPCCPTGFSRRGERSGCGLSVILLAFLNGGMVGRSVGLSIKSLLQSCSVWLQTALFAFCRARIFCTLRFGIQKSLFLHTHTAFDSGS